MLPLAATREEPPREWDLLLSATQKNNPERIRALITKEGVSASHANRVGQSALHIAALWGHVEALEVLLELGANTQATNQITGATPLHCAIQSSKAPLSRRIRCVSKLLEGGANPSIGDFYGEIPFGYCEDLELKALLLPVSPVIFDIIAQQNMEALKALVEKEPSCVNVRYGGKTPMLETLSRLLDNDKKGDSNVHLQMLEFLLDHGADPNASLTTSRGGHLLPQSDPDDPPLLQVSKILKVAFQQQQTERIEDLIKVASVLVAKSAILTPDVEQLLHDAARRNQVHMAKFLIDTIGLSVNLVGRQGMTPIQFAARSGNLEMIHFLLAQEGIDVNIADERGQTALHAAKVNGKDDVVALLEAHIKQHAK